MFEQSGQPVPLKLGHRTTFRHEEIETGPGVGDGLMDVPAIGCRMRQVRFGHERGVQASAVADLLDHGAEIDRHLGDRHRIGRREGKLELARSHLDLDAPDRHAHLLSRSAQEVEHVFRLAIAGFRQILDP